MSDARPEAAFRGLTAAYPAAAVRAWALLRGLEVSHTGGLPRFVYELYAAEQTNAESIDPR